MPSHKETKTLPHSTNQMLDLVLDIENYPEFLPWCIAAKITKRIDDNHLNADLAINFKAFFQKYSSDVKVINNPGNEYEIIVTAIDGPFKKLINHWKFKESETNKNHTQIEFFIDFEFKSKILEKMIGLVFEKATNKMINAFEQQAKKLYK